jgi:hypothetical protein
MISFVKNVSVYLFKVQAIVCLFFYDKQMAHLHEKYEDAPLLSK